MPEEEIPKLEGIEENVIEIVNELVNGEKGRGDKLGLRKTVLGVLQGSTVDGSVMVYNELNQLIYRQNLITGEDFQYDYDGRGNLVNNGEKSYEYDSENRLIRLTGDKGKATTFEYDWKGRRISKSEGGDVTRYQYLGDSSLVALETDESGNTKAAYTYDDSGRPLSMTLGGSTYYYHYNAHQDVVALTDSSGSTAVSYRYDPWGRVIAGEEIIESVAEANPYLYAGYRYDHKTGLYYLQARYYDPAQGRFISRDRWVGEQETPLTQNKYIYAVNSPANFTDPTGEKFSFSKVASRAKSAVSKVRNVVKSISGISKSKTSKGKAKSAASRGVAAVKRAAKSSKGRINNTVNLSVSTSKYNISKPSTYVNNNRQSGSRLVNSLNKAGGLKTSYNVVAKGTQLARKTYESLKGLGQVNKFVDRFSAGSKLAHTLGSKLINSKNIRNIGFGSNVITPTSGYRSELPGKKSSFGKAKVEAKKTIGYVLGRAIGITLKYIDPSGRLSKKAILALSGSRGKNNRDKLIAYGYDASGTMPISGSSGLTNVAKWGLGTVTGLSFLPGIFRGVKTLLENASSGQSVNEAVFETPTLPSFPIELEATPSDAGKSDPHGDGGRSLEKAQKQIDELQKQLEGAESNKERDKIKQKIQNIIKDAQRKAKGETHWRR